jgi:hypothetical protein
MRRKYDSRQMEMFSRPGGMIQKMHRNSTLRERSEEFLRRAELSGFRFEDINEVKR